jgi:hypothetical protein
MITIVCDLRQFSAKKMAFFSKTNAMIKLLHNLALLCVKNANFFAEFFGKNIFKIIASARLGFPIDLEGPSLKKQQPQNVDEGSQCVGLSLITN